MVSVWGQLENSNSIHITRPPYFEGHKNAKQMVLFNYFCDTSIKKWRPITCNDLKEITKVLCLSCKETVNFQRDQSCKVSCLLIGFAEKNPLAVNTLSNVLKGRQDVFVCKTYKIAPYCICFVSYNSFETNFIARSLITRKKNLLFMVY